MDLKGRQTAADVPVHPLRATVDMKRILIIDDSEAVRRQVAQTLGPAGYDVVEAADGMEGLAVIKSAQPALVLCDLNMPRMGGMELLAELARNPPLPLMVMLTTEAQPALIRRARELGAVGWIVKPFKADLLIAAVNKLTSRADTPAAPAASAAS
jgi:two-component system chemotaxis response regulator CheY